MLSLKGLRIRPERIIFWILVAPRRPLAVRETAEFAALAARIHHSFTRLGVMKE